jgi:hypothetical protein
MNIFTTEENLISEELGTSRKLLETKRSLKMFDFPTEDQFEDDPISKNKVMPIILTEEKINKFFKMKSKKLLKKSTSNKEKMVTAQTEANENNLTNFNIGIQDATISLISENKNPENSREDSIAASFQSHPIEFNKNDLMFNGAVNENNLFKRIEGDEENSQYLEVQVHNNLLQNLNNQENIKEIKEKNFESSTQRDEKKDATFISTNPSKLNLK